MLYSDIDEYPVYGKRASMVKEAGHEEWFLQERAIKEGGFSYISSAGNVPVLSFVKNIEDVNIHNYEKKQLGFLKLDLYMDLIFRPAATANEAVSYTHLTHGLAQHLLKHGLYRPLGGITHVERSGKPVIPVIYRRIKSHHRDHRFT